MAKALTHTSGIGKFKLEMQWNPASYDPISGGGISEYYFFFDDGDGMPPNFPQGMRDSMSHVVLYKPSTKKLVIAVMGEGYPEIVFRMASKGGHLCSYSYSSEEFGEDTPFLFGRDDDYYINWKRVEIELSQDEFGGEKNVTAVLLETIVSRIGKLRDEHDNALVTLIYDEFQTTIRIIKTPDRGYVAGVVLGDPFFSDDSVDGNSIEDVVSRILAPAMNDIALTILSLRDE